MCGRVRQGGGGGGVDGWLRGGERGGKADRHTVSLSGDLLQHQAAGGY